MYFLILRESNSSQCYIFVFVFSETGRVFTFGANDWGQLGLDHTKTIYKPTCVKSKPAIITLSINLQGYTMFVIVKC